MVIHPMLQTENEEGKKRQGVAMIINQGGKSVIDDPIYTVTSLGNNSEDVNRYHHIKKAI